MRLAVSQIDDLVKPVIILYSRGMITVEPDHECSARVLPCLSVSGFRGCGLQILQIKGDAPASMSLWLDDSRLRWVARCVASASSRAYAGSGFGACVAAFS